MTASALFPLVTPSRTPSANRAGTEQLPRPLMPVPGAGAASIPQVDVVVLGSDPLSREGVIRFLQECPDVRVSLDAAGSHRCDVVVLVVDRIGDSTGRTVRTVRDERRGQVVVVVGDLEPARAAELMQAGAVGIIRRADVTRGGLRRVIRSVVAGEAIVPPDVLAVVLGRPGSGVPLSRLAVARLNDREEKVLRLLAEGSDTREIGHKLCYSERTVKSIIQDITHRFGLRNRSHAVAYAIRQGLI
jgi:DNA-binding NarL/FixJ family response regulator